MNFTSPPYNFGLEYRDDKNKDATPPAGGMPFGTLPL